MKTTKTMIEKLEVLDQNISHIKGRLAKAEKAEFFLKTVFVNVDNEKLSDADFRQFIRNSLPIFQPTTQQENYKDKTV